MNKQKILIVILLILICALGITSLVQARKNQTKEAIGTYCAEGSYPIENIYLSLFRDQSIEIWGKDFRYRGTYTEEPAGKNIRVLITCLDGAKLSALFDRHDQVILDGSMLESLPDTILSFERINDVPGRLQ